MREVGHYAAEVGHYVSSGGGIMLQVVDANAGGGALCFRGGVGHYSSHRFTSVNIGRRISH